MGCCDDPSQAASHNEDAEDHDTIDPQEQQQEAWAAAEGYTPLADMDTNNYVMVSMGPDYDHSDEETPQSGQSGNDSGGVFFVNPLALGNHPENSSVEQQPGEEEEENDDYKPVNSAIESSGSTHQEFSVEQNVTSASNASIDEFQSIADKALMILDDEYQRTLLGERQQENWQEERDYKVAQGATTASTLVKEEEAEDLKLIAAAFDQRKKEGGSSSFTVDWDTLGVGSSSSARVSSTTAKATPSVDTDKVRKVVQALSEQKDHSFQQKFAAWQQQQQTSHDLIPPTPYKAFRRNTQKAKQATATLSRSATIAEALVRCQTQLQILPKSTKLTVDIVGVDHVECASPERIQTTFRPIIRWIDADVSRKSFDYKEIHLRLIGRDLTDADAIVGSSVNLLTASQSMLNTRTETLTTAIATCHSGVYHEWLQEDEDDGDSGKRQRELPGLIVAFNAGIWGYQEWQPTIEYLHRGISTSLIPMVVTAYTFEECQEDFEVIQSTVKDGKVLWEPELNPFGSKLVRQTKSRSNEYRENSSWQAWLLGCGSS